MNINIEHEVYYGKPCVYCVATTLVFREYNFARGNYEWIHSEEKKMFTNADAALKWFYSRIYIIQKERAVRSKLYGNMDKREHGDFSNRLYAYYTHIVNRYKRYSVSLDVEELHDNSFGCEDLFYGSTSLPLSRINFDDEHSSPYKGDAENNERCERKDNQTETHFLTYINYY